MPTCEPAPAAKRGEGVHDRGDLPVTQEINKALSAILQKGGMRGGLKYAVDTFPFGRIARAANKSVIMIHENTHNCVIMALGI